MDAPVELPADNPLAGLPESLAAVVTSPGWDLLEKLEARPEMRDADRALLSRQLRAGGIAPDVVAAVLTQLDLRDHAAGKFDRFARQMVFTRDGLEQATRLQVAALHAGRFRDGGATTVADLGCGIGGDALAIAGLGLRVIAVDRDPAAAACAAINLRAFGDDAEVRLGDVTDLDITAVADDDHVDAIFADPARRTGAAKGGRRVLAPDQWSPPLPTVLSWRDAVPRLGVKMAPGVPHDALPSDCHAQWVSIDGDLVEAAVWTPPLAPEGPGRSAQLLGSGGAHVLVDPSIDEADAPVPQAPSGELGAYLLEPDAAVIRSGLIAHLADTLGARLIDPTIAYLTTDDAAATASPFATAFTVVDSTAMRAKQIAQALRANDLRATEVKKRGADIDPARLLASLPKSGSTPAVVFATRVGGRHRAIIATRNTPTTTR